MNEKAIEAAAEAIHAADADKEGHLSEDEREDYRMMARAAIAAYEKAMWRPIEEAPLFSECQEVFVIGGRYKHPTVKLSDGEWWKSQKGKIAGIPTHFRPLPPVPEDE